METLFVGETRAKALAKLARRKGSAAPLVEGPYVAVAEAFSLVRIAAHVVEGTKLWLCAVYLADIALVSTDLALYFVYSRRTSVGKNL